MKSCWILLLAALPLLMSSCTKEQEVVVDDHCYISSVSLGSLKRQIHTLTAEGNDTTYTSTYTGSAYIMTIDQKKLLIENRDSLLMGTQLRSALVNITFEGASLSYRLASEPDSPWMPYSANDSLDLRQPLHLLATASDGQSYRIYTLKVNVHKQHGDSISWHLANDKVQAFDELQDMKVLPVKDNLLVFGKSSDGIRVVKAARSATPQWESALTDLPADAEVRTLQHFGDNLYMNTSAGDVLSSADGMTWLPVGDKHEGIELTGASAQYLYALMDGELYKSADATDWKAEALDESSVYLPTSNVKMLLLDQPNGYRRMVLLGYRSEASDTAAVVWQKAWNKAAKEESAEWMYVPHTEDNKYLLPMLKWLNVMAYDGNFIAFGGASMEGKGKHKALDMAYMSKDYGIVWQPQKDFALPAELKGTESPVISTVDDENMIWIIANKQVWRGRLNRLGFIRQ